MRDIVLRKSEGFTLLAIAFVAAFLIVSII